MELPNLSREVGRFFLFLTRPHPVSGSDSGKFAFFQV